MSHHPSSSPVHATVATGAQVNAALTAWATRYGISRLIHGACPHPRDGRGLSVDTLCDEWARRFGGLDDSSIERYPADWRRYGKPAGRIRNGEMVKRMVELRTAGHRVAALIFPGGTGTNDTRTRAIDAGLPVWDVRDGALVRVSAAHEG